VGQGISEVLTFAIGVAISPVPIIAVILMLFSRRAKVNGPVFLLGWIVALVIVNVVVYALAHDGNVATSSIASDSVSWGKIALGVLLLALARRNWRERPAPGAEPDMPKWMTTVDGLAPAKAFGLGIVLAGVNPKNLVLTAGAAAGLAQLGLSTTDAVVAIAVFVALGSVTIVVPVVYALVGGDHARVALDSAKAWLTAHNAAVLAALFLVFGIDLIAKGLPPLTS
jgi:Sap, sulfolipid-1-addressing protein